MAGLSLENQHLWSLSSMFGFEHFFLYINPHTIISTWALLALLLISSLILRITLRHEGIIQHAIITGIEGIFNLVEQSIGHQSLAHTSFIGSLFIFIFLANTLSLLPGLEEPTTDLNTTLALALISFIYAQSVAIQTNGFLAYIKGYFKPFFLMLPLNIIGKLSSIVSLSFRLYGNIFSGAVINTIYFTIIKSSWVYQLIGLLSFNILIIGFFTLFEGLLQALVFTMLSLTYLSIAVSGEQH